MSPNAMCLNVETEYFEITSPHLITAWQEGGITVWDFSRDNRHVCSIQQLMSNP